MLFTLVFILTFPLLSVAQTTAPAVVQDPVAQAHQALEHGKANDAIALLLPLAGKQPPIKGAEHELGLAYYRTGKLMEAKQAFAAAIQQDPNDMESVQMEGLTLYRLGQPAAAIPYLERIRTWMPNANTDANYVLGLCYLNAQRLDDARAAFAAQFSVAADSASAHLLTGNMLMHAHLPEYAATEAQKALQLQPDLPMAHFMLGEVYLYKSQVDQARIEFEQELRINPNYPTTYERLGDLYMRLGKLQESQAALTKALALDTSSTGPFILMGKVLLHRQDPQTAAMYLKHAEKMDPSNFITHTLLAQAYRSLGQEDAAKLETDIATKIHAASELRLEPVK